MARKSNDTLPFISLPNNHDQGVEYDDLLKGMPNNSIINVSIRLYQEEVSEAFE